jgi:hypothetical protein
MNLLTDPESVVQRQLDAFNSRDVDPLLSVCLPLSASLLPYRQSGEVPPISQPRLFCSQAGPRTNKNAPTL